MLKKISAILFPCIKEVNAGKERVAESFDRFQRVCEEHGCVTPITLHAAPMQRKTLPWLK